MLLTIFFILIMLPLSFLYNILVIFQTKVNFPLHLIKKSENVAYTRTVNVFLFEYKVAKRHLLHCIK